MTRWIGMVAILLLAMALNARADGPATRPSMKTVSLKPMSPPPELELVGPTLSGPPRYFDGDLEGELAIPSRLGDAYTRYYYYPAERGCFGGIAAGPSLPFAPNRSPAVPTKGW